MNKLLIVAFLGAATLIGTTSYKYSTTSVVTLIGGKILASNIDKVDKKYKRKDCPVCKGKGWYISGDDISKVECGYCEEEPEDSATLDPPLVPVVPYSHH